MPLFLSLRGLLVLLTASSVAFSLPQVPTIESVRASLPHPPTAPGPQSPQEKIQGGSKHAHLLARRAEIHELEKRQQVNCTNPEALFFTQCWIILNIQDYLIAPGTGWINTVRTCQDTGGNTWDNDGSTCCVKDEPWSTCYTRLNVKGANIDCTSASTGRCSESMLSNIKVTDPELFPYVRYTLKNIYAINNFFVTYYDALYKSAGLVGNNIEQMIQVVDKIVKPAFNVQNLLLGLAVGLAFLGAPSFALRYLSIEAKWLSGAAQGFVISAQQAPNVGRALWPEGTENSQLIQTADLHLQMSNLTNQMSIMMDGGVHLLMTEITTFVNYAGAGEGRYSGPNVTNTGEATGLTVPTATDALGYALKTYVLSYAMGMNRWYAGYDVGPYNSEAEVEAAFSCKFDQENYVCVYQNEYVTTGKVYFWSPTSLRVYTMDRTGPDEALEPYEMIKTINAYKWAPLDILFDGAFNCTSGGLAGSSAVTFNYDGRLDLACVSQLPMYTECGEMCPVALIGGECPFADVSKIKEGACKDYDAWL
ncbi:MAG: hypothetical protein LQ348_005497 [Seirophora lacunosa]|nr:MAG: hypothetical protein LQ344_001220 [Seirophora lacunosa]KAI4178939.1 MAG: hypothetical protein LQ348_005497 [Seirophora lacunosa]